MKQHAYYHSENPVGKRRSKGGRAWLRDAMVAGPGLISIVSPELPGKERRRIMALMGEIITAMRAREGDV